MSTVGTARKACAGSGAFLYQRHRPEKTLLYHLVSTHYPVFRQQLSEEGRIQPGYVQREEHANWAILDSLIDRYQNPRRTSHLIKGEPKACIPAFVKTNDIDLVVMGSDGRSGIPGLLIGNTAETVLQLINSSVITLKPAGFESPIK